MTTRSEVHLVHSNSSSKGLNRLLSVLSLHLLRSERSFKPSYKTSAMTARLSKESSLRFFPPFLFIKNSFCLDEEDEPSGLDSARFTPFLMMSVR